MESKTTKPFRHCPGQEYEISIFICRGRQKAHYPKCPECEFRTITEESSPIPAKNESKKSPPQPRQIKTGSIMVKSEPPSAEIYLDDDHIGATPAIITQILPGRYKIKIKMNGYDIWNQSVDVKANKETSLTATLQGRDASIVIESNPTEAEIFIDGNKAGVTPEAINSIKPGKYLVEIRLDGYETWSREINVEAAKKTTLTADLTTKYGSISLGSEPTKAIIFLDGVETGTTPASLRSVPHGTHQIEVRMDGYNNWEKSVDVEPGKETLITAILQIKTGSASIKSQPKNAGIYLDGKYIGTTPERIPSIIPGTHEIKVKIDDYDVWSETINVEAGKENVITAALQRSTGSLMVESVPTKAMILVDGKEIGHTPEIVMSSAKGTHTIEVRMDGYDIWKQNVDIEPGTEKSLTATLQVKSGSLNIKSNPSGGTIFLDGKETGTTPDNIINLKPDTHIVEVRMDGYENWSENIEVRADQETHLTAVLQQLTGSLNIKSKPPSATVIVDGNEIGSSPIIINELVPGTHMVEARKDGFETWSESINIVPDKKIVLTATLQAISGSLGIYSEPSDAAIFIDSKEVGRTPLIITDPARGEHLVEVRMKGYENWGEIVNIVSGKETSLSASLQLKAGTVCIKSEPSIAMILIDDKEVGTTPLIINNPSPGTHNVEIKKDGYENWSESVDIEPGKDAILTAVLQLQAGSVTINSMPSEALILIDGKEIGTTPLNISDPDPGKHAVEIRMVGYEVWSKSIDIEPGKEVTITADLQMKAGSININSNLPDATINIDGKNAGKTPETITDLSPGTYLVEINKEGYEAWSESVEVRGDKENVVTANLQLITGSVNIESNPSDAIIFLDGEKIGTTPADLKSVAIGTHEVEIKLEGYADWKKTLNIKKGREIALNAVLQAITGTVNIVSDPTEAKILLDGKEIGKTPLSLTDTKTGMYEVEIQKDGYVSWMKTIKIKAGKVNTLSAKLMEMTGSVNINSKPSNAVVHIDGKKCGNTPAIITDLIPDKHQIEVRMEGYEKWSKTIDTKPDEENAVMAELQMKSGLVCIKSIPSEAMILIDGKDAGITPKTITDLRIKKSLVEVRMEGYEIWSESIDIKPGIEIDVAAELQMKSGSLSISSDPSDAMILIDGKKAGTTPKTQTDIMPGKHHVEVRKEGFETWVESVEVRGEKENVLTAKLKKTTGSIIIKCDHSEAIIFLDGEEIGTTPDAIQYVAIGTHEVEVNMEGYAKWKKKVNIKKGEEITLNAMLQPVTGTVSIESEPTDAIILLDGENVGKTPEIMTGIKTGKHEVELQMDGYLSWMKTLKVKAGREYTLSAELQKISGSLIISSEPPHAIIYIQGKKFGKTPRTITELKPGNYTVEVKLDGYQTWNETVEIQPGKETSLKSILQAKPGSIRIKSNPSGANIIIDGNDAGTTPETINDLESGTHIVELKVKGYEVWSENVEVKANKESHIKALLQEMTGSISLMGEPPNATILLNGKKIGSTPEALKNLKPGIHQVEVRKDGFENWSNSVEVTAGKESKLTVTLQPLTCFVNINSKPTGATILIDNRETGITPQTIKDLGSGEHKIEVRLTGYEDWSESMIVVPDKENAITALLQKTTGAVTIKSEPSNAKIIFGGKEAGTTPTTQTDLKPGTYNVKILKNGYEDWMEDVNILPDKEIELTAALQYKTGSVNVKSDPPDSKAFIDGKETGTTPAIITDLKPGSYMLEVRKTGYENWLKEVVVETDKKISIVAKLKKITGSISVKSTPSKAKIYIDGEDSGTTPATLSSIPVGTHEIEIKSDGYEDWKKSITVKKDKEISVNSILQLNIGSISVESHPENAKIFLDGKEVGKTPKRLTDIIIGTHEVEILMDGYITWKKTIKIRAGKEISLTTDLKEVTDTLEIKADNTIKTPEIEEPITHEIPEPASLPEKDKVETITPPQKSKPSSINKKTKSAPDELIKLRSTYDKISESEIESLPFISIHENNNNIFFCHSKINHHYEVKPIGDGDVIIDHTTKLMWYQAGSSEYFNLRKAMKWLKKANKNCYAGFNDWRLPTLEEASSLLEFETKNDTFIDAVFDNKQWGTWTGDKSDRGHAWIVTFVNGTISQSHVGAPATFVRPVRSLNI